MTTEPRININDVVSVRDLPAKPAGVADWLIGVPSNQGGPPFRAPFEQLPVQPAVQQQIDALIAGQQTNAIYADTLAALEAVTGTYVGQGAFVLNGTGAGQYAWNGEQWVFLRGDVLANKVDKSYLASLLRDGSRNAHEFADRYGRSRTVIDSNGDLQALKASVREVQTDLMRCNGSAVGLFASKHPHSVADRWGREKWAVTGDGTMIADSADIETLSVGSLFVRSIDLESEPSPQPPILYRMPQVLVYGESLSVGGSGSPALTTANNTPAVMFRGGVRTNYYQTSIAADYHDSVIPLVEGYAPIDSDGANVETICSGAMMMYYQLLEADGYDVDNHQVLISAGGRSGKKISEMMKGDVWYPRMALDLTHGPLVAKAANATSAFNGIFMMIGSNDQDAGTAAEDFIANARLLRQQIAADATAGRSQPHAVPMLFSQTAPRGSSYPTITLAIRELHKRDPLIFSVGPSYQFDYTDNVHMTNESYRWRGAHFGWWLYRIFKGERPEPMQPVAIIATGNAVQVRFNYPVEIDTTWMSDPGNYGFQVFDDEGDEIDIDSVTKIQPDMVEIVCDAEIPSGSTLGYAIQPGGSKSGRTGRRGNIRDNSTLIFAPGVLDLPMHNWCEVFHEPIEVIQ